MSQKNNDRKGRWRNKIIAFRVSPEEDEMLERKVAVSGLTKQDYLINCVLDKDIIVNGNPYVYRNIVDELRRLISIHKDELTSDDQEFMNWILKVSKAMEEEKMTKVKAEMEPRQ